MADIYPLASSKVQKEISQLAGSKIKGMSTSLLRSYMEKDIISYSSKVETELLERCRRFSELPDKQRKRIPGGSDENPLTHILRLWQIGKIPNIEVFRELKGIDSWFSFVCFPEEFDYKNFNVECWCTWLSEERYRKEAFQKNHKLLQDKFRQVIDEGTGNEDVRRIYYKYLE